MEWFYKLKRAFRYFIQGWSSEDWDYEFIFKDLLFKLKRLDYNFENEPYHDYTGIDKKSLKLAIKLLDRYLNKRYDVNYRNIISVLGKVDYVIEASKIDMYINGVLASSRNKEAVHDAMRKDDKHRERDLKLFFKILEKYHDHWWS